ncbi:acyl-CoA thioesterase domain-containing protein [Microbacterium sp. No. 7]|uniref:acyl-CoA thioesterase domain-containing protein n=1 Tax=Microbacterium sp. No. 7 TaxID=1714373 RepID=UPI0006D2C855|nr:acyl-CoA thioesterase domain-containing protein [Microbacterium sp. No. 7]ALJ19318.1 hypothetical protein AOA12_05115 [Microbacterium sp. No. 7]
MTPEDGSRTPFFIVEHTDEGEVLHPTPLCRSGWGETIMRGPATCTALARETERVLHDAGGDGLVPARFSADLFRPALMVSSTVTGRVVHRSRRLAIVEATMSQGDRPVARSTTLFVRPGDAPDGDLWTVEAELPEPPPLERGGPDSPRLLLRGDGDWTPLAECERSAERKSAWVRANPAVAGEPISPFAFVASVADVTNMIAHWGAAGVQYINADVTLNLVRTPSGQECGLSTELRYARDGVSQGVAAVFDRDGLLGTTSIVAITSANAGDPRTSGTTR